MTDCTSWKPASAEWLHWKLGWHILIQVAPNYPGLSWHATMLQSLLVSVANSRIQSKPCTAPLMQTACSLTYMFEHKKRKPSKPSLPCLCGMEMAAACAARFWGPCRRFSSANFPVWRCQGSSHLQIVGIISWSAPSVLMHQKYHEGGQTVHECPEFFLFGFCHMCKRDF